MTTVRCWCHSARYLLPACLNLVQFASRRVMLVNQASVTSERFATTSTLHGSFLSMSLFPPTSFVNTRIGSHDSIYSFIQVTIIKLQVLCLTLHRWRWIEWIRPELNPKRVCRHVRNNYPKMVMRLVGILFISIDQNLRIAPGIIRGLSIY